MFGMHTLVQTRRQWEYLSGPDRGKRTEVETSWHASTIEIDERHGVEETSSGSKMERIVQRNENVWREANVILRSGSGEPCCSEFMNPPRVGFPKSKRAFPPRVRDLPSPSTIANLYGV